MSTLTNRYHHDDMLTREQLAQRLQVHVAATYRWRECPRLRVGREHRFVWGDVLDWLTSRDAAGDVSASRTARTRRPSTGRGGVFQMPHRTGGIS